ncbi:MAG: hypothetical protein ACKV2T_00315 [Kofleriaceae bacterium]
MIALDEEGCVIIVCDSSYDVQRAAALRVAASYEHMLSPQDLPRVIALDEQVRAVARVPDRHIARPA